MQGSRATLVTLLVVVGVLLVMFMYPVQAFTRDYLLEVAYIDKSFNLNPTQVKEVAFKVLSGFVDWNRMVYSRIFVLNINGTPILYAKAFMVPYTPVTTTCITVTTASTPVTKECETVTTTAPPNAGFTYYPTSNGMIAVYVKAELSLENGNIADVKILDYYKTILGKNVWDPVAIGNIVAQSVWESQATIEAVVRAVVKEHLEPKEIWLSTAELVYPPEHILSVIFIADDYIYGVIYDWEHHRILVTGLDIIEPPYYLPGQQHLFPTTPIAESKRTTAPTTQVITTYPTTTETRMPPTITAMTTTTVTTVYVSAETTRVVQTTQQTVTTQASTPTTYTETTGEKKSHGMLSVETSSRIPGLKTLNTMTLAIVAASAIVAAFLSWIVIRRILV